MVVLQAAPRGFSRRTVVLAAAASSVALPSLSGCEPAPPLLDGGVLGANFERGHILRDPEGLRRLLAQSAGEAVRKTDVLVVGGGVAGLACARALQAAGQDWALLELEDRMGGNAKGHVMRAGDVQVSCPMGAHYLPVPDDNAALVQDLLIELGLAKRTSDAGGRRFALTPQGERHLCHSPQERLFFNGHWQDGLLPMEGVGANTLAQYRRFSERIAQFTASGRFKLPVLAIAASKQHRGSKSREYSPYAQYPPQLFATTFAAWLKANQFDDPHLLWYLDYCCRDDYGAGADVVSAQAGIHYFASRHGFGFGAGHGGESVGVLAWPQGNAWLTERMADKLHGERPGAQHTGCMVLRVVETANGIEADTWYPATQKTVRWVAKKAVFAVPVRIAARMAVAAPLPVMAALKAAAQTTPTSSWVVANVALRAPLLESLGAPASWDNVSYGASSLGYVDAMHQSTLPGPGPTVLTWYKAMGVGAQAKQSLLDRPWSSWRDEILGELAIAHPDIYRQAQRLDLTRYAHAMAVPAPGVWESMENGPLAILAQVAPSAKMHFAHSDLAGYSIFEEALTVGTLVGQRLAA